MKYKEKWIYTKQLCVSGGYQSPVGNPYCEIPYNTIFTRSEFIDAETLTKTIHINFLVGGWPVTVDDTIYFKWESPTTASYVPK